MAEPAPQAPTVLGRVRAAPVTFTLLAINVAVFVWVWRHGGASDTGTLLRFGASEPLHVWAGEYWRVVTYMFLHGGLLHLGMNTYVSIGWSTALERALGKRRLLLVYFLSGAAGGCASIAAGWLFGPHVSVGASGALFGVVGAALAIRARQLKTFSAFFADKSIRSLLIQIAIWTAIGSTAIHLDNAAHFGGLFTGFAATWLFTSPAPRAGWLALGAALGALFLYAAHPWWTPEGKNANRLVEFAKAYATGVVPDAEGGRAWPKNPARAQRFFTKACTNGIDYACEKLSPPK